MNDYSKNIFTSFVVIIIVFAINVFTQNKIEKIDNGFSIDLNFEEPNHIDRTSGVISIRDYKEFTDASLSGKFKLPSKIFLVAIPPNSKPIFRLAIIQEEIIKGKIPALQPRVKKLNDSTLINEEVNISNAVFDNRGQDNLEIVRYGWYRQYYCVEIKINTHSFDKDLNQIRRIKSAKLVIEFGGVQLSFDINSENKKTLDKELNPYLLNAEIADQFTGKQHLILQDTTGNWINYGSEYLKIGTANDGLFRITKPDLEAQGINTSSINPKTLRLFESGLEIPITVSGEEDNVFNDSDYIQFYGKLNYSKISYRIINAPNEPYNEYLNRYSDTTFYFLTWGGQDGKRIQIQDLLTTGLTDTLNYFTYLEHTERNIVYQNNSTDEVDNQTPGWQRNKSWYPDASLWFYSNTTRNYNFSVTDVIPNKNAKFYYKAVSFGSSLTLNAHQLNLKVNNVLIDSQSINRNDQVLLSGTLNTNLLKTTANILSVKNYANGSTSNTVVPDWYDIEYPRSLKLNNDFILFNVADDVTKGLKNIIIGSATNSSYEIYKLKPFFKKINNYQIVSNQVVFTDTVEASDQYIVATPSKIGKPVFYYKKVFTNLRSNTTQADYIAITHPLFWSSANNYVNTIAVLYGVTKDLISVQDIFDEFSFGYPQPDASRLFTAVTYQNRHEPKPQYLTLIGDADYDYKRYRFKSDGVIGGGNFVPSYGNPVSDNWLVIWDENGLPIPQMKVGRIPINSSDELDYYLSKVENNFDGIYDEWNKRYLFFSGGRADFPSEIAQLKATNDQVINNYIKPAPLAGSYTHFYKTTNPLTDFGPYSSEEVSTAINDGGVFISYLGHSGTATWDNSISEPVQLKNNVNRNPLITDFGCSTNKFAEPDIVCFGERFLLYNDGQAIGYIGNSSLGFTSTALTLPVDFYGEIIGSSTKEIGNAHLEAKIKMFQDIGTGGVYNVFALTNTLLGDPVIRIKVPYLPNLKISSSDVLYSNDYLNDAEDSTQIKIVLNNYGIVDTSKFYYSIQHILDGNIVETFSGRRPLPSSKDTMSIWVDIKNKAGENSLVINLDPANEIKEIYEDANSYTSNFYVYSTTLRDLVKQQYENPALDKIDILNPSLITSTAAKINFQLSESKDFQNVMESAVSLDSFFTSITINSITPNKRYWFRYKLDLPNSVFSNEKSFYNYGNADFNLVDSVGFNNQKLSDISYKNNNLSIIPKLEDISVTSAGFEAGATCIIAQNGINLLANTFFAGMGIVVFDDVTFNIDTSTYFNLFNNPTNMTALVDLINTIPQGKIVAMGVSDDAANNITSALKNAIKSLGSTKIDSLTFRGSWALIGKKGAIPGNVLEQVKGRYDGLIYIDSTFIIPNLKGTLLTNKIGPSSKWESVGISENLPSGSSIDHYLFGIKSDGSTDSLGALSFASGNADLGFVNPKIYPNIKIKSEFNASADGTSPQLNSLGVSYTGLAELGTNYQVVSVDKDTIPVGGNINLTFWVYNVGEADADSFNVKVDVISQNNSSSTIFDQLVTSLPAHSRQKFEVNYQALSTDTTQKFLIEIDPGNKISEYYKDNNFFSQSFYVKPDLTPPTVKITVDETDIINGDFVSKNPNIKIALSDESPVPITDTTAVKIYLNEMPIYYAANTSILSYSINSNNPKFVVDYKPELKDGDYLLRVVAKDPSGNIADSASSEVYFVVSAETKLMEVYNYPNPFSSDTYFTFKLSQIPEEIKIRIYTIAGRMIKEIVKKSSDLNYDLNKIYWDGKDEDGDPIANGTYLYKMIMKTADKIESVTQKLVIVR